MIAKGHKLSEIRQYTQRQLDLFFKEAQELDKAQSAAMMIDINAAFAGGKAFNERFNYLKRGK